MSIQLATKIILAAMRGSTSAQEDEVENTAWIEIEQIKDVKDCIQAIRFANDVGILSIEWKFGKTNNPGLARLLWNEFGDDISPENLSLSDWKQEIVECPRAKKPCDLEWHKLRLKKGNFPITVSRLQIGEIFGGVIEWGEVYSDVDLEWTKNENNEMGMETDRGDTFRSWNSDLGIYLQTDNAFENNEQVARIAL